MISPKRRIPWNKGKKASEEARRKMSETGTWFKKGEEPWNKGRTGVYSEEVKRKMSNARKGRFGGEKHPMFGKHHSKESKEQMSSRRLGITSWNLGKKFSEETRRRISAGHKGQTPWNKGKKTNRPSWNKGKIGVMPEKLLLLLLGYLVKKYNKIIKKFNVIHFEHHEYAIEKELYNANLGMQFA